MSDAFTISTNSVSSRRRTLTYFCDLESPLQTAWTNENPGRRFHGCGLYKLQGTKGCAFFNWFDAEMTPRAKEVILSLMKRINELKNEFKNKDNVLKNHEDELKFKLKFFKGLLAFSWKSKIWRSREKAIDREREAEITAGEKNESRIAGERGKGPTAGGFAAIWRGVSPGVRRQVVTVVHSSSSFDRRCFFLLESFASSFDSGCGFAMGGVVVICSDDYGSV
ncbi:hypothetical protein TSUD_211010 [Trifolium subterraneum]|uniref:Zinc finger GRF-type domain-containing protein n=1 Tax=Trifolium subterraneum TaxID=3900 RepID=A0A2Z6NT15_TRISU|nr:hypothetical protein TSUD_211010 [Trifolium subterraneum]